MQRARSLSAGHELAMALRTAYLLMHRTTDAHFADAGVTADQFVLLTALSETGATTQQELAARIASDPNTLRAMLLLLEKKGLVQRERHPDDGRARLVTLTDSGNAVQESLWARSRPLRDGLASLLGPEDTEQFVALLRRFARALPPRESAK